MNSEEKPRARAKVRAVSTKVYSADMGLKEGDIFVSEDVGVFILLPFLLPLLGGITLIPPRGSRTTA
jgi:hypothetical protein